MLGSDRLDLQFIAVRDNGKVSGIEVAEASAAAPAALDLDMVQDADSLL